MIVEINGVRNAVEMLRDIARRTEQRGPSAGFIVP